MNHRSLWFELKNAGIDVLALSPGATKTEAMDHMAQQLGSKDKMPPMPVSEVGPVVATALNALGKKPSVVHGLQNSLMTFMMTKVMPRSRGLAMIGSMMQKSVEGA